MRPHGLKSRIFLDGGDPGETERTLDLLGFLDGQTTNPTLISKNPRAREHLEHGGKFTEEEIIDFYRDVVRKISGLIPKGSISVEVYSDLSTPSAQMLGQGKEMYSWIHNAQIKFPSSHEGLKAAEQAVSEGMRINMTLCFSQEQAAAAYSATLGAKKGEVYVSPFVGRLDDRGENGMDLVANMIEMFRHGDGHVEVLTASVRKIDHLLYAIKLGSDIITVPFEILKEWGEKGLPMPGDNYSYNSGNLKRIPYKEIDLSRNWREFDLSHDLTTRGMEKFSSDWNSLISHEAALRK